MSKPVLAYWGTRCLAEPIRMMFEYLEIDYVNKIYPVGDAPSYDKKEWWKDKKDLGFDFPNLPYLIDGEMKLTESWAIMKYLGRKHGLYPKTPEDELRCDLVQSVIEDFRFRFINMTYYSTANTFDENKKKYFVQLTEDLENFSKFIGPRKWLCGDSMTYVDFGFCEALDQINLLFPNFLAEHPVVKNYYDRFYALSSIDAYKKSGRFKVLPINNKYAFWGGKTKL